MSPRVLTNSGRERDFQRKRLYKWEREVPMNEQVRLPISLEQCRTLVEKVYEDYGIEAPKVTDGRGCRTARGSLREVKLPEWARTPWTVLHECAHGLVEKCHPWAPGHGPEFVRVYVTLLDQYYDVPATALVLSARSKGIMVAKMGTLPKRLSREEVAVRKREKRRVTINSARRVLRQALSDTIRAQEILQGVEGKARGRRRLIQISERISYVLADDIPMEIT